MWGDSCMRNIFISCYHNIGLPSLLSYFLAAYLSSSLPSFLPSFCASSPPLLNSFLNSNSYFPFSNLYTHLYFPFLQNFFPHSIVASSLAPLNSFLRPTPSPSSFFCPTPPSPLSFFLLPLNPTPNLSHLFFPSQFNKCSDRSIGGETFRPFMKLYQTGQPIDRPTDLLMRTSCLCYR